MNTVLRSLFVWLLLLALPVQGVAAAARMLPSVAAPAAMAAAHHCHDTAPAADAAKAADAHHPDKHHGACADCCIAAAPVPATVVAPACAPPSVAIPFRAGHVPSVDPALPERPPRLFVA
ncbi:hypothetical protein HAV22_03855 [Massilia sp. TW-1]|uniref:DUF2946 domain-containing protein n=1 Tax=Telluria antibiotica TaxID=2717319 RepID=A0ABX0P6F5_9BURK|nr:hypothetical protein [Telluria antibiotica]NIA52786.1 hypothetical protein [Telluria antibiotica]